MRINRFMTQMPNRTKSNLPLSRTGHGKCLPPMQARRILSEQGRLRQSLSTVAAMHAALPLWVKSHALASRTVSPSAGSGHWSAKHPLVKPSNSAQAARGGAGPATSASISSPLRVRRSCHPRMRASTSAAVSAPRSCSAAATRRMAGQWRRTSVRTWRPTFAPKDIKPPASTYSRDE
jgi:hypothetical protein